MNIRPLRNSYSIRKLGKSNNDDKPASEFYHRARRILVLISSLLFGFSLAGLKLTQDKSQPLVIDISKYSDSKLSFSNPELLPYFLVIITFYLVYRLTIEWYQSSESMRKHLANRIDVFVSISIGLLAILSFLVQSLTKIMLADIFNLKLLALGVCAFFVGQYIGINLFFTIKGVNEKPVRFLHIIVFLINLFTIIIAILIILSTKYPFISGTITFFFISGFSLVYVKTDIIINSLKFIFKKPGLKKIFGWD
jgi:uncharacterized membrane protein YidH (DUF202 family)